MWSLSFDNISETMDTPGPMLENEYALCGQALNHKNTIHRV
jgi:hypothetical protein